MFHSLTMLAIDANRVVGLRVIKLMRGGRGARREAQLMVSEKIDAAFKASASLMAGASGDENSSSVPTPCSGKCETARQAQFEPPCAKANTTQSEVDFRSAGRFRQTEQRQRR